MAEWFRALDLKSGGSWFKSSTLPLSGFVLDSPEFNSSTALCKEPTGRPPTSWNSQWFMSCLQYLFILFTVSLVSTLVLNTSALK